MVPTPALTVTGLVRRVVTSAVATATLPINHGSRRNARQAVSVDHMRARARADALREYEQLHRTRQSLPTVVLDGRPMVGSGAANR